MCPALSGRSVASWLVHSTPERAVRVGALAGEILLCSWARHFTLTVLLSTQVCKWVPANLMLGVNPEMEHPIQRGVEILLVVSCYRNRDKLPPDGPLGSYTDFTLLYHFISLTKLCSASSFNLQKLNFT